MRVDELTDLVNRPTFGAREYSQSRHHSYGNDNQIRLNLVI